MKSIRIIILAGGGHRRGGAGARHSRDYLCPAGKAEHGAGGANRRRDSGARRRKTPFRILQRSVHDGHGHHRGHRAGADGPAHHRARTSCGRDVAWAWARFRRSATAFRLSTAPANSVSLTWSLRRTAPTTWPRLARRSIMLPKSEFHLHGMMASTTFLRGTFDKLGIYPGFSPHWRLQERHQRLHREEVHGGASRGDERPGG